MLMFLINHLLSTPDCHPTTAPVFSTFLCCTVTHFSSGTSRPFAASTNPNTHTHTHAVHCTNVLVFFFVRVTILLYCVVFLAESLLFFFPCLEVAVLKRSKLSRLGARGKKSNKQTKRPNEHRPALIRHFVLSHVCLCVCVFATRCTYHDVHEACRLMDMFVITENVMLLFLFVFFLSPSVFSPSIFFVWLLTAVFLLFFFLPSFLSFPHFVLCLCPVPPLFSSSVLQHGPRLCSFASPSSPRPPPHLSPPPPCRLRETGN